MTQKGFENYIFTVYDSKNGTAKSYITAIHIIDEMFECEDEFNLKGQSIACIDNVDLLLKIKDFIYNQQYLYKKGSDSIFRYVSPRQKSYPGKGFCSAAMNQLLTYCEFEMCKQADSLLSGIKRNVSGKKVSEKLTKFFDINKEGEDKIVETKTRIGQEYFRRMLLEIYDEKCSVTGLNIPQVLRASHIIAWKEDKKNRMNPENGILLSATYDAAFDKHLISFDEDYKMIISKEIKDHYTSDVVNEYFFKKEGDKLILPSRYLPSQDLLQKHRELLVR